MGGRRRVRTQPQSKGDDKAAAAAAVEEGEMEIVRGVAGEKKRGRSERDNAAAAAAADGEETGVEHGKKPGGNKTIAAAAAQKKQKEEDEEEEVPTPKRIKIWEQSTELTDEFLVNEIGINPSRSKEVVEKLKAQDVITVGELVGSSREQLDRTVEFMGPVNAIMLFIEGQKGKIEE